METKPQAAVVFLHSYTCLVFSCWPQAADLGESVGVTVYCATQSFGSVRSSTSGKHKCPKSGQTVWLDKSKSLYLEASF